MLNYCHALSTLEKKGILFWLELALSRYYILPVRLIYLNILVTTLKKSISKLSNFM